MKMVQISSVALGVTGITMVGSIVLGFGVAKATSVIDGTQYGLSMDARVAQCIGADIGRHVFPPLEGRYNACLNWLARYQFDHYFQHRSTIFKAGFFGFIFSSVLTASFVSAAMGAPKHVRGRRLLSGLNAARAIRKATRAARKRTGDGIELAPGVKMAKSHELQHFLLRGSVGSGKTQIILNLLNQFIKCGERVIVLDVKGDFVQSLPGGPNREGKSPRPIIIGLGYAASSTWAIGEDCLDEGHARDLAARLIKDAEKNAFFSDSARNICVAIVLSLIGERGRSWGWSDLYERMIAAPERLSDICKKHYALAAAALEDPGGQLANDVLATLRAGAPVVKSLADGSKQSKTMFSLRKWLLSDRVKRPVVILGWRADQRETSRAWMAAFVDLFGSLVSSPNLKETSEKTVNVVLDEFAQLPKMDGLAATLDVGRSKGVCAILACQDVGQLRQVYGSHAADAWLSTVGHQIVCKTSPGRSAEEISRAVGDQFVFEKDVSRTSSSSGGSTNERWVERRKPVITPNELSRLLGPRKQGVRFIYLGVGEDAYILEMPYISLPKRREGLAKDVHDE